MHRGPEREKVLLPQRLVPKRESSPMRAECNPESMLFGRPDRRAVVADFGGGAINSDAGASLLGATDMAIALVERFVACFSDGRAVPRVAHDIGSLVAQWKSAKRRAVRPLRSASSSARASSAWMRSTSRPKRAKPKS